MFFEDFKETVIKCGKQLSEFKFSDYTPQEAIDMVLECETTLFRARIKLEHEFNIKRF